MFKDNLLDIYQDLKEHHRDKNDLLASYIETRLNKSLEVYYESVLNSYNTILNCTNNQMKIIKKVIKGM